MSPAVASLLRRLVSIVAGASAGLQSQAATPTQYPASDQNGHDVGALRKEEKSPSKLVYGKARQGMRLLATHRSHSSHSSHASHYSGSSGTGGGTATPNVPPATATPPKAPASPPAQKQEPPAAAARTVLTDVLKKLPRIRSHWPSEAILSKLTQFNLYDGEKVIGVITLNPGTKVKIVQIKQEHVIIKVGSNESPLPVENTDIVDRMGGAEKIIAYPDDAQDSDKSTPKAATGTK